VGAVHTGDAHKPHAEAEATTSILSHCDGGVNRGGEVLPVALTCVGEERSGYILRRCPKYEPEQAVGSAVIW
jgi:hypothetical protein